MDTPMLKRQLNPFLLASTVLVLSLLAGMSVLYQGQLSNIVSEKKDLNQTLTEKNQRINELQTENERISGSLNNLQSDKSTLQGDINNLESRNSQLQSQIDDLEQTVSEKEAQIEDKNTEISNLESDKSNLEDEIDLLNGSLKDICGDDEVNLTDHEDDCTDRGVEVDAWHFD